MSSRIQCDCSTDEVLEIDNDTDKPIRQIRPPNEHAAAEAKAKANGSAGAPYKQPA